jgi:hypothetical protein
MTNLYRTPLPISNTSIGSALRSNKSRFTAEPGSASTIKPRHKFMGVGVPSPIKPSGNLSSLALTNRTTPQQPPADPSETEDSDEEAAIVIPRDSPPSAVKPTFPVFEPQRTARASGASGFTNSTTGSKMANLTTTTATSNARSVGPAPPPNAKQIGRPSTSTAGGTEFSGASRGPVESSANAAVRRSAMKRTSSLPASQIDEDDLEGEKILSQFQARNDEDPFAPVTDSLPPSQDPVWGEFSKWVYQCIEEMLHYEYDEGIQELTGIIDRWWECRDQFIRDRDDKGRVSRNEQDMADKGEGTSAAPARKGVSPIARRSLPSIGESRSAVRLRHSSKTPSSHEGTDFDTADESALQESDIDVTERPEHRSARLHSTPPRVRNSRSASKSSKTPVNANVSNSRVAKRPDLDNPIATPSSINTALPRSVSNTPNHLGRQPRIPEEDEDEETKDEVAPLPAPTTRVKSTRSRRGKNTETESVGEVKLRRGRSASVAPSDAGTEVTLSTKGTTTAQKSKRTNSKTTKGK